VSLNALFRSSSVISTSGVLTFNALIVVDEDFSGERPSGRRVCSQSPGYVSSSTGCPLHVMEVVVNSEATYAAHSSGPSTRCVMNDIPQGTLRNMLPLHELKSDAVDHTQGPVDCLGTVKT
jgi:hypothetical protein